METIEKRGWVGEGYQPLVLFGGWQVALLNWEPAMDPASLCEIERHKETDEVFVLVKGQASLFAKREGREMVGADLEPGSVYNIPRGVWHNLLATPGTSLVIVEDCGTDRSDTEIRPLTSQEAEAIQGALPDWLRPGLQGASSSR